MCTCTVCTQIISKSHNYITEFLYFFTGYQCCQRLQRVFAICNEGLYCIGSFSTTWNKITRRIPNCNKDKKKREEKEEFLTQLSSDIVMQFVETKQFHLQQGQAEKQKNNRIACGYPGCQKNIFIGWSL